MIFISLGAGVQSTCLTAMSVLGDGVGRAECAIFADTGWERQVTYDYLEMFVAWCAERDFTIHRIQRGNIREDFLNKTGGRVPSMPLFTPPLHGSGKNAMLRRQCTLHYKIEAIQAKIRDLLGYRPRQRIPAEAVRLWVGISLDEADRMKPSSERWIVKEFPLIDLRMKRLDCENKLRAYGLPVPSKSACIGCPYHDNGYWRRLKQESPEEFADACQFDEEARAALSKRNLRLPVYVHRSLKPLAQVNFGNEQGEMFTEECEGMCGV